MTFGEKFDMGPAIIMTFGEQGPTIICRTDAEAIAQFERWLRPGGNIDIRVRRIRDAIIEKEEKSDAA